jgi:valyl-tRNA synthetase
VHESEEVAVGLAGEDAVFRETVEGEAVALHRMARVTRVSWARADGATIGAHAVLTNGVEVFLPLEGVIDLDRERERLSQEIDRLAGHVLSGEARLSNASFVARAPAEVVEKEREKARSQQEQLVKLREKLVLFRGEG